MLNIVELFSAPGALLNYHESINIPVPGFQASLHKKLGLI